MEEVAKNVFVETSYDGVNVGALLTPTGVICIDVPSYARDARDWAARLHRLSPYAVQVIFLTDCNGDRLLNTRWLNAPITMQQNSADTVRSFDKKFPQAMLDSLAIRQPHRSRELSNGPVERATMSYTDSITLFRSGHRIVLQHAPGPLPGSSWVILPDSGVVFAGDTVVVDTHPHLMSATSTPWLQSLDALGKLENISTVVPGRGPIGDSALGLPVRQYIEQMRERVHAHVESGLEPELLSKYVPEFLSMFSLGSLPVDWVKQQIMTSLGNLYLEVQSPSVVSF